MRGLPAVIILVMLLNTALMGQHRISGGVIDGETKEPLVGANVYLLNNWRVGSATDLQGMFTLEVPGETMSDSLVVSFVGYTEKVVPLQQILRIALMPKAEVWEEVVVTASPLIAEEFKYMKIEKLDIYTNPAAKADPILAVNALPAATTTDESANISLRGSSPLETGIFMNNVPIYDAVRYSQLNGIGTFSLFNTSVIKNVTVFPGNPPLEYGNATSGIISLETDDYIVEDNTNSMIVSLANLGYSRQQKISSRQSIKVFTNYQPSGAMKALNEQSLEDIESFKSLDLGIYWYGAKNRYSWKVFSYSLLEGYDFNFQHPSYQGIFQQDKKRSFVTATVEREGKNGNWSLNSGGSLSRGDFSYSNVAFEVDNQDLYTSLNYLWKNAKYQIKTGFSVDHRESEVRGNFHQYGYALGPQHPTDTLKEKVISTALESFAYFKYYLSDKLATGGALRWNFPTRDQKGFLSHQLNLSYNTGPWSITGGFGRYHKNGLEENTGSLMAVTSEQWALDAKYQLSRGSLTASVFSKRSQLNNLNYDLAGVELFAEHRFMQKIEASVSFIWVNAKSPETTAYPYDLRYFVKANLSYSPGKAWTIEGILSARDGVLYLPVASAEFQDELEVYQPTYSKESLRRPAYFSLGLSLSKIFVISDGLAVIAFASLNNLTDHPNIRNYSYAPDYSFKVPNLFSQRTGYMGVVLNF